MTQLWQSMPALRTEIAERIEDLTPGINKSVKFKERSINARKLRNIQEEQGRPRLFQLGKLEKQDTSFFGAGTVGTSYNLPFEVVYPLDIKWHAAIDDDIDRIRQDLIDNPVAVDGVKGRWVKVDILPSRTPHGDDPWQVVTIQIYCLMGVNVELEHLILSADTGLIVVSGEATGSIGEQTYELDAETGDLVISGEANAVVNTPLNAETGDLVASGSAACVVGVTLDAETGDLVLAGDCDLIVGYTLAADSGDAVISGEASTIVNTSMDAETGLLVAAAGEATGNIGLNIDAETGDIVAVAGEATAVINTPLDAETGAAVLSGSMSSDIGMTTTTGDTVISGEMTGVYSGDTASLDAETGDLVASGEASGVVNTSLDADTGLLVASGSMASGIAMTTEVGDLVASGSAVGNIGTTIDAETGDVVAIAGEADLIVGHVLAADTGDIVISGEATGEASAVGDADEDTVFVDEDLTTGEEDGTSWTDAYHTLAAALTASSSGDDIWVKENTSIAPFTMQTGVNIYGGFSSTLTGTAGTYAGRDFDNDATTIDGGGSAHCITADAAATIDGLRFYDGDGGYYGGVADIDQAVVFRNCTFDQNAGGTGAIYCRTSITFDKCTFTDNTTTSVGGAIRCNTSGGTITITDCLFDNCESGGNGGVIYIGNNNTVTITDTTFVDCNSPTTSSGGAIYSYGTGTTLNLTRVVVNNCTAQHGGGVYVSEGDSTIDTCLFINNYTTAGTENNGAGLNISGGGDVAVINTTFADNTANGRGGAILVGSSGGSKTVINSVLYDNTAVTSGDQIYITGGSITVTYSNVEGGYTGSGNVNDDPEFTGSGDTPYKPNAVSDGTGAALLSAMTDNSLLGRDWASPDMGCYRLEPLYVDENLATGSDNGSDWENAYQALADALTASASGNTIWVKEHTGITGSGYQTIDCVAGVNMYGGFASSLTGTAGTYAGRDFVNDATVIDGEDTRRGFVIADGCIIDGFTIIDCYATWGTGGAINADEVSADLLNLTISNCYNYNYGGGIYAEGGAGTRVLNITDVTITDCSAARNGGGIYVDGSSMTVNCNRVVIDGCDGIHASYFGGGVCVRYSGTVTMESSLIVNCENVGNGGGIGIYSSSYVTCTNCTIADNISDNNGGGIYDAPDNGVFINCCIYGNTADSNDQIDGSPTVTYSNVQDEYTGTGNIDTNPHFRGSGDHPYQPDEDSDMIDGASNGDMTDNDILGDAWADDTMGCYNLDDSE